MRTKIGLLSIVGFFGLLAAANAQAPSSSPFDGTYRLVSATKVNNTYVTRGGQMGRCPDRRAGPLTVVQGRARYTSETGRRFAGTVGPQGELAMQYAVPTESGGQPVEQAVRGGIDRTGTARARQLGNSCSYDFVWQR